MSLARALAAVERFTDREREWLVDGIERWLRARGTFSLAHCLDLPKSPEGFRKALRDYWLCEAYWHCAGPTRADRARALFAAARRFESRTWPRWHHLANPPDTATELEAALFEASRAAELPVSRRQFARIATSGQNLQEKCQAASPTMARR